MKTHKADTVKALSWNVSGNIINKVSAFVISIILARILTPEEFGLMAIVMVVSMIVQIFTDFGFASAVIQNKTITKTDLSSIFFLNIVIGLFLSVIFFFSSEFIALFFGEAILSDLIKIISITFLLSSIGIIPSTILRKQLNFKALVLAGFVSTSISGAIAIIMAINNFGVYSLLAQSIIQVSINMPIVFILSKWKPIPVYKKKSVKKLFSFSLHLFLINLISKVLDEFDSVLIAKFYPIANLGIYKRAKTLSSFPLNLVYGGVNSVLFPSMSRIQDDDKKLLKYYSALIHILSFILIPICFLLVIVAKPLILILLTEKWVDVIPFFQIIISVGFMFILGGLNSSIIIAKGDTKFLLKFELIKRLVLSLIIIVSLYWGILSMVISTSIATLFFFLINLYYGGRYINFSLISQLKIVAPYLILSITMMPLVYFSYTLFNSLYFQLLVPLFVGSLFYLIFSKLIKLNGLILLNNEILKPLINKFKTRK